MNAVKKVSDKSENTNFSGLFRPWTTCHCNYVPLQLDRDKNGGGIMMFTMEDIPHSSLNG